MHFVAVIIYSAAWVCTVYLFNRMVAGHRLKMDVGKILLYVSTMAALGLLGEVIFDSAYRFVFGRPLWLYRIAPIHHGYTSLYSFFLWGTVGFYLYLLHDTLKEKGITSRFVLAGVFCLEAILLEAAVNVSYHLLFGGYIFYYLPSDLWHFTSVQTLPLYLLAGLITILTFEYAKHHQKYGTIGSAALAAMLVLVK
jgi:hypothetical protein